MLRLELITTDKPLNYQSGEKILLNPTPTEPDQMGSKHLLLIRWGIALLVQLRCFMISDQQGAAVKAFATGTALMAQSHLGLPKLPW